jgi:septin 3/9/12
MHCEFVHIRNFLIRTHLFVLIENAKDYYERYRTMQLVSQKQ